MSETQRPDPTPGTGSQSETSDKNPNDCSNRYADADDAELDVICTSGVSSTEWRESTLTGGLLAFKSLCGSCFPELADRDDVDVEDVPVDRVVRSTGEQAPAMHLHPADAPADHPLVDDDRGDDRDVEHDRERCESCERPVSGAVVREPGAKINLPCGCRIAVDVDLAGGVDE